MKKIYELVILKKLRLSENFPQRILYARKMALRVRLIALRIIMDILALRLYVGNERANNRVG